MMRESRSPLAACLAAAAALAAAGCGEEGPEKYEVSGRVVYGDATIQTGDIIFEPKEGLKSLQTMTRAEIKDGQYTTWLVGGTHIVTIRDLTGDMDMDRENFQKLRPVLRKQYRGEVDYPPLDEVRGEEVTKDIVIPETFK